MIFGYLPFHNSFNLPLRKSNDEMNHNDGRIPERVMVCEFHLTKKSININR